MKLLPLIHRLASGSMIGLAGFGLLSYLLLLNGAAFWPISLPIALMLGIRLATVKRNEGPDESRPCPSWLKLTAILLLLSVLVALTYGAGVSPSRHWDGAVAWELKAWYLTQEPSLEQDFFRGEGVFNHSRDYPLLQPLCIAAGNRLLGDGYGRLIFPFLWVLLIALVGLVLERRCRRRYLPWLGMLALGLTPMLTNPVMGGADSGFADLFMAVAVLGMGAGIVLRNLPLLAAGILVSVFVKPEGMVYGFLPVLLFWCRGDRSEMHHSLASWCLGMAIWLPLQHELQQLGRGPGIFLPVCVGLLALAGLVILSDRLMLRMGLSTRGRWISVSSLAIIGLFASPLLVSALENQGGTLAVYLSDASRPLERLPGIPVFLYGLVERGMLHGRFALGYTLLAVAIIGSIVCQRRLAARDLAAFLLLGMISLCLAYLLSPEQDLEHHLRASMDRLLLHWLGPALLVSILYLDQELSSAERAEGHAPAR
ncbi:MAG: hypothetical protein ACYTG5_07850 [Planctomycetota bacterium]|jgi:hypothetical protein